MIVDYEPEHLLAIQWQRHQDGLGQSREHAEAVMQGWIAKTALQDGLPVLCAGIVPIWPGRAMAWAAVDWRIRPSTFLAATRETARALDAAPFQRLEMYVKPGFAEGWRWAEMLGFRYESKMRRGNPAGGDLFVFTRFNRLSAVDELTGKSNAVLRDSNGRRQRGRLYHQRNRAEQSARIQRAAE